VLYSSYNIELFSLFAFASCASGPWGDYGRP